MVFVKLKLVIEISAWSSIPSSPHLIKHFTLLETSKSTTNVMYFKNTDG